MPTPKLKPCPFCGGNPSSHAWVTDGGLKIALVQCRNMECLAKVKFDYYGEGETLDAIYSKAVTAWNRRAESKGEADENP